jgi:hypothetical protein
MSVTLTISESIAQQLDSVSWAQGEDIENKLFRLLEAEYRRRLARYHLTDRHLTVKYGMSFDEFERHEMTRTKGYTWDVESDAIAWETAVDGISTVERQLRELLNGDH